ncbi:hypothetical protein ACTFIR_004165 [Dictyostelium discoideum]
MDINNINNNRRNNNNNNIKNVLIMMNSGCGSCSGSGSGGEILVKFENVEMYSQFLLFMCISIGNMDLFKDIYNYILMDNNLKNSSDLRYQYIDLLLELNRLDIIKFLIDSNLIKDDELFQNKLKRSYPKSSLNHFTINNLNIINNNNNNNTINEQKLNTHTTTTTTITKFPLFKFILKKTKN